MKVSIIGSKCRLRLAMTCTTVFGAAFLFRVVASPRVSIACVVASPRVSISPAAVLLRAIIADDAQGSIEAQNGHTVEG